MAKKKQITAATLEGWRKQLERLTDAFVQLAHDDAVFEQTMAVWDANAALRSVGGPFHLWMQRCYSRSQAIGLRALFDGNKRSTSLRQLLREMQEHAFDKPAWDVHVFPRDLTRTGIQEDRERIEGAARQLKEWVDMCIAHTSKAEPPAPPSWHELRGALRLAEDLIKKYHMALNRNHLHSIVAGWIGPPWQGVYRQPWLHPGEVLPSFISLREVSPLAEDET